MRKKPAAPALPDLPLRSVYPRITVRISAGLQKHLHEVAAMERRKVSDLARLVLSDYCAAKLAGK